MSKSGVGIVTWTVMTVVCESVPFVTVIVTGYEPVGVEARVEIVSVESMVEPAVMASSGVLNEKVRPLAEPGELAADSVRFPMKPKLLSVTSDVEPLPGATGLGGGASMVKSPVTTRLKSTVRMKVEFPAVTLIV